MWSISGTWVVLAVTSRREIFRKKFMENRCFGNCIRFRAGEGNIFGVAKFMVVAEMG